MQGYFAKWYIYGGRERQTDRQRDRQRDALFNGALNIFYYSSIGIRHWDIFYMHYLNDKI